MKQRGLSIKYKILLLLCLVPVCTLAIYLFVAIKTFENDKIPYVFESTTAVANTLSQQVTTDFNSVLNQTKPVIQEFLSQRQFGNLSRSIVDSDGPVEWVAVFGKDESGQVVRLGLIEKFQTGGERDLRSFGDMTGLVTEVQEKGRVVRMPFKNEKTLLAERVGAADDPNSRVFFIMSQMRTLANSFRAASGAEVFLVNQDGFVLFGPVGSEATYLTERLRYDVGAEIRGKNQAVWTKEIRSGKDEILASFAKSGYGTLAVVSLVDKKEALKAVQDLVAKSIYFFIALIAASTIVSLLATGSLTSSLTELFRATKKIAEGDFGIRVPVKSRDEVGSLANSFNAMAEEVSRLLSETAEKARMESELKTAQTVQETLFPPTEADLKGLRISGYYEPASECGGDWWHYCEVNQKVFLWIGDATGHGAPAALITSAAKSAATIIERLDVDVGHALQLMNRAIYDVSKGKIMMTFFLACYDTETKKLTYANASHEGPYLLKKTHGQIKKRDLIPLNDVNAPRLGQDRDTAYEQAEIDLDFGDRILFYTDGIPDIENQAKEPWGEREFIKGILATNQEFPPVQQSVHHLVDLFSAHRQNAPLKDDITFFMVQVTDPTEVSL